jgi:signal transduction histidine kinase
MPAVNKRMDDLTVLVVDDERDIRDGSERILSRMGCRVTKASRGDEALTVLGGQPVSIILLDLKMPGMDGMEVLKRIQEMESPPLVIVITGYATVDTAIEAMKRGAYDFVAKPFEPDQLRIVVSRAREKIRLTEETERLDQARQRMLFDLDTEKSRIRTIIESLPNGIVVTNAQGQLVLMNPAFTWQLKLDAGTATGQQIGSCVGDKGFCQYVMDISKGTYPDPQEIPGYEFVLPDEKYLLARGRPVMGEEGECLGAVVVLSDITTLKVLDRLKSEFVAKVSHELRSPLSTIHEQLALVLRDLVGEASQKDLYILARAKEKTEGLISLIGDLLDLSRIESGTVCHEPRTVQIEDLLKSIVDFLSERAKNKSLQLILGSCSEALPPLAADPLALESIFGNLIVNAINYTPEGGEIRVKAESDQEVIRVSVQDTGIGIAPEDLGKIFDKFYRVQNEKTRHITGTGLGLSIVKGLLEGMGGKIEVESSLGEGSIFTVSIPVGPR